VLNSLSNIISSHGLKKTPIRLAVGEIISQSQSAVSQVEIEKLLPDSANRVTVYRVLRDFEDAGIIHKIIDTDGVAKFALCHNCDIHHHHDQHVHFNCTNCNELICFENITLPKFNLPEKFQVKDFQLILKGVCNKCYSNKQ
jgi:Fur family ferric uptake transcriptional regulator